MPHPRFKHQWEEDSYWKHYDNHQEQLLREENKKAEAKAKDAKPLAEPATKAEATKDGWQTVSKR